MINVLILGGEVLDEPLSKTTESGYVVCNFRILTIHRFQKDGIWEERPTWNSVVVWGHQAEWASEHLHKGDVVFVIGRLQTRSWDDRDTGKKQYRTEVVAQSLTPVPGASGTPAEEPVEVIEVDDGLPF